MFLFPGRSEAQELSNLRTSVISTLRDTVLVDSLSLVPGSLQLTFEGNQLDTSDFTLFPLASRLVWKDKSRFQGRDVQATYRTFPYSLSAPYRNKDIAKIEPDPFGTVNPFKYSSTPKEGGVLNWRGLNKRGSISRGINFGNNQNLSVNSNLNLELTGKVSEDINISAVITDNSIPIQAEGNTQQLQEFDQVYITLFDKRSKLTAGDFQLNRPKSYFMTYLKRAQGGSFTTRIPLSKLDSTKGIMRLQASAAVSRGKFARNIIQGIEGNQGPYRLRGADNEQFIIVLSGTERVFIDGKLLVRGQENDYIIDYNTAEVVFTAKQLITKDKRIIIEFQYSDKNFARSLVQFSNEFESERVKLRFNLYSEQDGKNQSLQQELDGTRRDILRQAGDSLHLALAPGIDTVDFSEDRVLYRFLADTLLPDGRTFDSIFVYSTNSENARFQLAFSDVGQGNGNYILESSTANGRVYRWAPPDTITGLLAGSYEPIIQLIAPQVQQMITLGGEVEVSKTTDLNFEGAMSNRDINTFSSRDSDDNIGFAFRTGLNNRKQLSGDDKKGLTLVTSGRYEFLHKHFEQIERFRTIEFFRDWNIRDVTLNEDQHITGASVGLAGTEWGNITYGLDAFNSGTEFNAYKNFLTSQSKFKGFEIDFLGSWMLSDGSIRKSDFLRHKVLATKKLPFVTIGFRDDVERNFLRDPDSDSLLEASYSFLEWEAFITNPDTTKNRYRLSYTQRSDAAVNRNSLRRSTFGESVGLSFEILKNPRSVLKGKTTYRTLRIVNDSLTTQEPDNTFLNRLEYNLKLFKGAISSTSFFEIGSGLEARKEFAYIEVAAGQGVYSWTDYNDNGVQELDEFEVAAFQDKASFIKVFTATDDYVKTFTNQFNQSLQLQPASVWSNKKGWRKTLSHFSHQVAFRIDRRTNKEEFETRLNPFLQDIADTNLQSLNSSLRNTLYFNRSHPIFGADINFQNQKSKTLLTSGFESRSNIFRNIRARWNFTRKYSVSLEVLDGVKVTDSDIFSSRNFDIDYREFKPRITYQPGTRFRLSVFYEYALRQNSPDLGNEKAENQKIGSELKYNSVGKGSLIIDVAYIGITYDGETNNSLAFEMLDGLQPGTNSTWSLSYQRTLGNNLQLSLNYNGRKSEDIRMIHAGGVQVRAFF